MVQRWDIIAVGNLSRNRYWGQGDGFRLLVDLSLADREAMAATADLVIPGHDNVVLARRGAPR